MTSDIATSAPTAASTLGVVGLGTMGAGIAEVFARHGYAVVGVEPDQDALDRGRGHLRGSTDRAVRRGKLSATDQEALLGRVTFTTDLADTVGCGLVVEAVSERLELKQQVLARLDAVCGTGTILATNTSSLSVTEVAAATDRPERVVGMHFFNPAPVQRLVEVVQTVVTDPAVAAQVRGLATALGKTPVSCGDRAGFIANGLLFGYLNRAVSMLQARFATREDIDAAMQEGCGYPMGPLALLDLVGLDTAQEIQETLYAESGDPLHAPSPLLRQMVTAGMLGRKTGRGFYAYDGPGGRPVSDADTPDATPAAHREVATVGVLGAGPVVAGLVEDLAKAGYAAVHVESHPETMEDLHGLDLGDLDQADLVLEAVDAEGAVRRELFARLDDVCKPGAVLATTFAGAPVVEAAAATRRPQEVLGLRLGGPVRTSRLAEVVSTVATTAEVAETGRQVCASLDRVVVSCADRAGFLVDALLFPYLNDAVRMLQARYATTEDVDTAMTQGCALPMGPFDLLDTIGTDVALATQRRLYAETPQPGLAPAPLLRQLVTAGHLGTKAGRGFRT